MMRRHIQGIIYRIANKTIIIWDRYDNCSIWFAQIYERFEKTVHIYHMLQNLKTRNYIKIIFKFAGSGCNINLMHVSSQASGELDRPGAKFNSSKKNILRQVRTKLAYTASNIN